MRRKITLLLTVIMVLSLLPLSSFADEHQKNKAATEAIAFTEGEAGYWMGNDWVASDATPYLQHDRLMVPVAHASRALGAVVTWKADAKKVVVAHNDDTYTLTIGSTQLQKNGEVLEDMDTIPVIQNIGNGLGRTMLPVAQLAKAFNVAYTWDAATRTAVFMPMEDEHGVVYNEAGTYGPEESTETIDNNVIISAHGVTLQNLVITGNLTITEDVGDGDVILNNVDVEGEMLVQGGGKDSIHINGGHIRIVIIQQTGIVVRIVTTDGATVETVSITGSNSEVLLDGEVQNLFMEADNAILRILSGSNVGNTIVLPGSNGSIITIDTSAVVGHLQADGNLLSINNLGTIDYFSGSGFTEGRTGLEGMFTGSSPVHFGTPPPPPPPPPPPGFRDRDDVSPINPPPPPPPVLTYPLYAGAMNDSDGTVIGSGNYAAGTRVTLLATPAPGKAFQGWESSMGSFSQNPLFITMPSRGASFAALFRDDIKRLQGTAQLTGNTYFDEVLTVSLNITSPTYVNENTLYYMWFSDGVLIPNAEHPQYILQQGDIGKSIHARVLGDGILIYGHIDTPAVTIGKIPHHRTPPPLSMFSLSVTDTSVHLTSYNDWEYKLMQGSTVVHDWQATGDFTGLDASTEYQMYGRYKETPLYEASVETPALSVTTAAPPTVVSWDDFGEVQIPYGTSFENVLHSYFPTKITIRDSLNRAHECEVTWESHNYNGELPGVTQIAIGYVTLPDGVNANDVGPYQVTKEMTVMEFQPELFTFSVQPYIEHYTSDAPGQVYIGELGVTSGHFELGSTVELHAIANQGYRFTGEWVAIIRIADHFNEIVTVLPRCFTLTSVCCTTVEAEPELRDLYAVFELEHYQISVESTNGGRAYLNNVDTTSGSFTMNTEVSVTAIPEEGYDFTHWSVGDVAVSTESTYTFETSTNDLTIVAIFAPPTN